MRRGNLITILRYVRDHGPSSRYDIAQGCGLGVSTMTDLIGELRSRRLLRELERIPRLGAGRPTRPIALDGDPWCVLGIQVDLLEVQVRCTTVNGQELWSDRVAVPLLGSGVDRGYPLLESALEPQLDRIPADKTLVAVQVGLPGSVATDRGTVGWSAWLGWDEMPLRALLAQTLVRHGWPDAHVALATDSHLAALHAVRLELPAPPPQIAVYLGGVREVGGAVILDGKIFHGADGGAGDFGHARVDPQGPACPCGRRGCLESMVGPARLLVESGLQSRAEADDVVVHQPLAALQALADAADRGEERVLAVLAEAGDALGVALDGVIGTLNPHLVMLGGYLGVLSRHLLGPAQDRIAPRSQIQSFAATTVVPLPQLVPRVLWGATLAAQDACLEDPLHLTSVVAAR